MSKLNKSSHFRALSHLTNFSPLPSYPFLLSFFPSLHRFLYTSEPPFSFPISYSPSLPSPFPSLPISSGPSLSPLSPAIYRSPRPPDSPLAGQSCFVASTASPAIRDSLLRLFPNSCYRVFPGLEAIKRVVG